MTPKPASSVFDSKLAAHLTDQFADDDALALDCAGQAFKLLGLGVASGLSYESIALASASSQSSHRVAHEKVCRPHYLLTSIPPEIKLKL
jgi:hypothetical protein